jgi:hypothetical protein
LWALVQFEDTPKAFANFSPGLELATTLGHTRDKEFNAESVGQIVLANAFSVGSVSSLNPGLKQPWATFSERLRRMFKLNQYRFVRKLAKAQNVPRKMNVPRPGFWYDLVSLP